MILPVPTVARLGHLLAARAAKRDFSRLLRPAAPAKSHCRRSWRRRSSTRYDNGDGWGGRRRLLNDNDLHRKNQGQSHDRDELNTLACNPSVPTAQRGERRKGKVREESGGKVGESRRTHLLLPAHAGNSDDAANATAASDNGTADDSDKDPDGELLVHSCGDPLDPTVAGVAGCTPDGVSQEDKGKLEGMDPSQRGSGGGLLIRREGEVVMMEEGRGNGTRRKKWDREGEDVTERNQRWEVGAERPCARV